METFWGGVVVVVRGLRDAVSWVLHEQVLKASLNVVKIFLVSKTKVVYSVTKVKSKVFFLHVSFDIRVSVCSNMKITRNAINLEEAF